LPGHIPFDIELVYDLWQCLPLDDYKAIQPSSEDERLHRLHLVASHRGELQFGSPVEPKTPEAVVLKMIANLGARFEIFAMANARHLEIAPGIDERTTTLNSTQAKPLSSCVEPS
jgi:3'-5' exoribonuclease